MLNSSTDVVGALAYGSAFTFVDTVGSTIKLGNTNSIERKCPGYYLPGGKYADNFESNEPPTPMHSEFKFSDHMDWEATGTEDKETFRRLCGGTRGAYAQRS